MWRWILLIYYFSLVTVVVSSSEQCARYPKQINVDQLYDRLARLGHTSNHTLPFINSRDYLSRLARDATLCEIKSAIIVVGPKSSGKSEGFKQIIPIWKELGHIVLDIDLKGRESNVVVMRYVAKEITDSFGSLDYQPQQCVLDELYACVKDTVPWWLRISDSATWTHMLYRHISPGITILTAVLTAVLVVIKGWLLQHLKKILLFVAISFLFLAPLGCVGYTFINWYRVVEFIVHPIQESIASGNWYALTCSSNALSKCVPERRPIVIVRELTNLNSESLNAFLRSLERMKQGDVHYPVFAESSDFQWAYESPVIKSSDSFMTYRLQEMTREEGLAEVVHKFKIWTKEEYEQIYDAIRGHLGSYRLLYDYNKVQKLSLNESIWHLKRRAYDRVIEAVEHAGNYTAVRKWLLSLRISNYIMMVAQVPKDIWILFKRNILFRNSDYVYPQNRLMEHAVDDFIHKFFDTLSD